jgi:predicted GH43/DUF377 family glycosyl hydrolase
MFTRSKLNPILKPNPDNAWEAEKLYNPGMIYDNGVYHMYYRAVGKGEDWKSSIGYATSTDGENFIRHNDPMLVGQEASESRGLEDPRITKINNTYYMAYAAYDGVTPRLCIATSKDLKNWKKEGSAFPNWNFTEAGGVYTKFKDGNPITKKITGEWSKSGGIIPEKINGKYQMLFGEHRIWFADSEDGLKWEGEKKPFLEPRSGDYFDNTFVEMGPPPILTVPGWLVLYHGINDRHVYQIGVLILDKSNPKKILYRSNEPIFKPEKDYEMSGIVDVLPGGLKAMQKMSEEELKNFLIQAESHNLMPHVTFCCGATVVDGILRIYYGASDTYICTATAHLEDILKNAI